MPDYTFFSTVDRRAWINAPNFSRSRSPYRGTKSSEDMNLEMMSFLYDVRRLAEITDGHISDLNTHFEVLEDGGTLPDVYYGSSLPSLDGIDDISFPYVLGGSDSNTGTGSTLITVIYDFQETISFPGTFGAGEIDENFIETDMVTPVVGIAEPLGYTVLGLGELGIGGPGTTVSQTSNPPVTITSGAQNVEVPGLDNLCLWMQRLLDRVNALQS